ncbi:HSP20-like chaperone [Flammula alnicola]|nr:HSP20-like chaperone [Flammula alnicola]
MSDLVSYNYNPFYYGFEDLIDNILSSRVAPNAESTAIQRPSGGRAKAIEGAVGRLKPKMDLHEDAEKNLVTATFELPGLKKEDVDIDVNNHRLSISGESKRSSEYEEGGYAVRERDCGKFSRVLQLPHGVKENQIKAHLDNGILTVTFPKASAEKAPKKITIN